jgi:hypothetical protein
MISQAAKDALFSLIQDFEREESSYRDDEIREITKNVLFFEGKQDVIYDWEGCCWRGSYDAYMHGMISFDEIRDYSRNVNEYRAHGEAIIAALSLEVPKTRFFPKRANNPADIIASRAYSKAAEMILAHNDAKKMLQKAFFTRYNQHFVAIHTYFKRSADFGTIAMPKYEEQTVQMQDETCALCGNEIQPDAQTLEMPGDEYGMTLKHCEGCNDFSPTQKDDPYEQTMTVEVGTEDVPQGRVMMDVYGPLHVLLPHHASHIRDCGFLRLSTEHDPAYLESLLREEEVDEVDTSPDGTMDNEKFLRTGSVQGTELTTLDRWWVRPWEFNRLEDTVREELEQEYPDGVLAFVINDRVARCYQERMDHYWAVSRSPISHQIHSAPHGRPMIPVQEMLNDLTHLTMETIRHGVSITFADPEVLSFKQFGRSAAKPGKLVQAKPRTGMQLANSFYQTSHATLSKEVEPFRGWLQQAGQFVLGSFPSIYGGQLEGSRTFSEYESSRQQALQRLSLPWDDISALFAEAQLNGLKCLKDNMSEEETFVQRQGHSFIDVLISQEELSGEIGDVVTEIVPQYPTTWAQKRAMLFELLEKGIPEIGGVLFLPENADLMKEVLTMNDLYVPGAADRDVQLLEIAELLKSEPLAEGVPSVMPDPELDNLEIHMETSRVWLNSIEGRDAKVNNPAGYENVLFHFRLHKQQYDQMLLAQQMQENDKESEGNGKRREGNANPGNPVEAPGAVAGANAG